MNGRAWTWLMVAIGVAVVFVAPFVEPFNLDNARWHLYATGCGAAILGLGLGRLSIGRE